jgi:protein-L-isoaspartate O-methyltransferase
MYEPNSADWRIARDVYRRFVARPGAENIATAGALAYLAATLRQQPSSRILEFGAGIGTITYLLLTFPPETRTIVSTEANPFCLDQLRENIPAPLWSRLMLVSDGSLPTDPRFDLIIVDGKVPKCTDYSYLREGVVCFVEGNRGKVRSEIESVARTKGLTISFVRLPPRGALRIGWHPTRFGFSRPHLRFNPYCSIGLLRQSSSST